METGNSKEIAIILKQYKTPAGHINYPAVFSVPIEERLPALYKRDFLKATALVVGALAMAFERLNIKKKTESVGVVINNIAEEILDTADQDNISLEDLMLFLQKMVRGEYGEITEMSVAKFMILFNKYRDERHLAVVEIRENEHLLYKDLGDNTRSSKEDCLSEHLMKISDTISQLKQSL